MNKYFTLINIVIHFVINPVFVNYSYSNNEIKYLKVKSFNLNNNPFDYNSLKKIVVPITFPKYNLSGRETCKTNRNSSWTNSISLYGDENFLFGFIDYTTFMRSENGFRIYMGTRKKDKILFKVIEAHEKWNNMLNWINGYSIDLKNQSIEEAFKQTLKGKYASSGSYRRQCEFKIVKITKAEDTYRHLILISYLEKKQRKALELMSKLGMRFVEKYDFEGVKVHTQKFYKIEQDKLAEQKAKKLAEEKAKKLAEEKAEQKAKKLAEEKAKRKAKQKTKQLAEEKAKREVELKTKKLAEEKAKREVELKAKKLAEEKAKQEAEEKTKREVELKAQKLVEEKAKQEAEEKTKREVELKAQKLVEEKAKQEHEEEISKLSEKFYETYITLINAHNIMEKIVKEKNIITKDNELKELNKIKIELNNFFQKPIESYTHIEKKEYAKLQVEYSVILRSYYNKGVQYGKIPYNNEYSKKFEKYLINLLVKISDTNQLYQGSMILNEFKRKFLKSEWPDGIDQKIEKLRELQKSARTLIRNRSSGDIWQKYIYPSNLHLKKVRLFKKEIKNWASSRSEDFKSFYNKKLYEFSIQKNINELKEKQKKEEDFFNKISN